MLIRFGILRADHLPSEELPVLGPTGSDADRHPRRMAILIQFLGSGRRHRPERQVVGVAMLSFRAFTFEQVYLGPNTCVEHERARDVIGVSSPIISCSAAMKPDVVVDYLSAIPYRFALHYAERVRRGQAQGTRLVEAVGASATIVHVIYARARPRKVGGRYTGASLLLFHEEKTPSFSVLPHRGTDHCFGCGVGGYSISFVRAT